MQAMSQTEAIDQLKRKQADLETSADALQLTVNTKQQECMRLTVCCWPCVSPPTEKNALQTLL